MRQSGILAAAGLHALEHHRDRLVEDHRRARELAEGVGRIAGLKAETPDTNIVMLDIEVPGITPQVLLAYLAERGILMSPFGPRRIRAVTHLEVEDEGIRRALGGLTLAMRALAKA